jgi:hypothetical protein
VLCHECGARGPRVEDSLDFSDDKSRFISELERKAIEAWNERNARHRSLYDSSALSK